MNTSGNCVTKLIKESQSGFINFVRARQAENTVLPFATYVRVPRTMCELFKNIVDRCGTFSLS